MGNLDKPCLEANYEAGKNGGGEIKVVSRIGANNHTQHVSTLGGCPQQQPHQVVVAGDEAEEADMQAILSHAGELYHPTPPLFPLPFPPIPAARFKERFKEKIQRTAARFKEPRYGA